MDPELPTPGPINTKARFRPAKNQLQILFCHRLIAIRVRKKAKALERGL